MIEYRIKKAAAAILMEKLAATASEMGTGAAGGALAAYGIHKGLGVMDRTAEGLNSLLDAAKNITTTDKKLIGQIGKAESIIPSITKALKHTKGGVTAIGALTAAWLASKIPGLFSKKD